MAGIAQELAGLKSLLDLTEPAKDAQAIIDLTISDLEEVLSSLKRHRNGLSPIGRLSDDILGNIFTQCSLDSRSICDCLTLTAVCSMWRSIALETPRMWSRVVVSESSPLLVDMCLRRSKATEVTIYLEGWVSSESWDAVKPHCDRISTIILEGDAAFHHLRAPWFPQEERKPYSYHYLEGEDDIPPIIEPAFPVPALKTFILHSPSTMNISNHSFPPATHLQTLELSNTAFGDWETEFPDCPSLKALSIYFSNQGSWMGVSWPARHGLSGILSRVPLIESVAFVCIHPLPDDEYTAWYRASFEDTYILLPHLKELTLQLPTPEITSLLRVIRPGAPLDKLDLHCLADSRSYYQLTDTSDLIDVLGSTHLSTSRPLVSASFEVGTAGDGEAGDPFSESDAVSQLSIRLWDKTPTSIADRPAVYALSLSLTRPITQTMCDMFDLGVIRAFNKQFQTVVNVVANGGWSKHHWQALARMPRISSLTFLSSTPVNFFVASFSDVNSGPIDSKTPSTIPFLSLSKISIYNAVLPQSGEGTIQRLVKVLGERSQSGSKLSSLYFEGPDGLSQSDVDALAAVVTEVKVVFPVVEVGGGSIQLGGLAPDT